MVPQPGGKGWGATPAPLRSLHPQERRCHTGEHGDPTVHPSPRPQPPAIANTGCSWALSRCVTCTSPCSPASTGGLGPLLSPRQAALWPP